MQVFADQRVQRVHRKSFLRQKNLGPGFLLHIVQGFQVLLQQSFINQVGRRRKRADVNIYILHCLTPNPAALARNLLAKAGRVCSVHP
ncbi:hypothetical protein D3C87_1802470 [compost metagenome]